MQLTFSTIIDRPRDEVWRAFDNPANLSRWQPTLQSFDLQSGTAGQIGAVSNLVYQEDGRRIEMTETITQRREPDEFSGSYNGTHAANSMINRFTELDGGRTQWDIEAEFQLKGAARFLGGMLRGMIEQRVQADAQRFKTMLEAGQLET